jgi:hypothetical protein
VEETTTATPDQSSAPRRRRQLTWQRPSLPTLVLAGAILVQLVVAIVHTRTMWYLPDDWYFVTKRGLIPGWNDGLFEPFAGHWMTGPVFVYRFMFTVFGMQSYLPFALMTILLHLGMVVEVYLILRRVAFDAWTAVSVAVVLTFAGVGAEAFLWDATMPQMGSLFLGLLVLLVLAGEDLTGRDQLVAGVLLCVAVAFSGFGIGMAMLAFAWLLSTRSWLVAVRTAVPSLVLFVIWFLAIGHTGSPPRVDAGEYLLMPQFVWTGLTSTLGTASGIPDAGAALLIGLILGTVLVSEAPLRQRCLAWSGIAAAVGQLAVLAVSRLAFGLETAAAGRYRYAVLLFLTPSLALVFREVGSRVVAPRWMAVSVAGVLLAAYVVNGLNLEREYSRFQQALSDHWKSRTKGVYAAVDQDERILTHVPRTAFSGGFDPRVVVNDRIRRALPELRADGQDRLDAENEFFVGVGTKSHELFSPTRLRGLTGFDLPFGPGPGCFEHKAAFSPSLVVETRDGTEIGVTSPATMVKTQLRRGSLESEVQEWKVDPGSVYVATSAKDADLVLTFDQPGKYVICSQ